MGSLEIINQPYALTVAEYKSSIHVERVIDVLVNALQPEMIYKTSPMKDLWVNKRLIIKTKDFLPEGSKHHDLVKKALIQLKKIKVRVKGVDGKGKYELFTGLILRFKYYKSREFVEIEIGEDVSKFLLNNSKGFTKFSKKLSFLSSSPYTLRIYKYISQWRDKRNGFETTIYADFLKSILCLGEAYVRAAAIYQNIILPAEKRLKANADIWFSLKESVSKGRKTIGWKIKIYKRENKKLLDSNNYLEPSVLSEKLSKKAN